MNINPVSPKEQGGKLKKIQHRVWKILLKLIRDLSLEAIKELQKYTPAIEFNTNLIEFIKAHLITYWKERDRECTNLLDIKQTILYCQFGFPLMFYWMRIELCDEGGGGWPVSNKANQQCQTKEAAVLAWNHW